MNIIDLENKKNLLLENLNLISSHRLKALLISEFFGLLLTLHDNKSKEAYLLEFINDYLNSLEHFDPFCIHPDYSKQFIEQLQVLERIEFLEKYNGKILQIKNKIQVHTGKLVEILCGNNFSSKENKKNYFPLIEKNEIIGELNLGNLETITVRIEKTKNEDKFIVIPRERELEERIEIQIKNSWIAALNFCKSFIKRINPYHKVFIQFDKMYGEYVGKSFGVVLTLEFIEELLKLYNAPDIVNIKDRIAFTGGMDVTGNIEETTKKIIQKKTESVFFSPIETFVVHKEDETAAFEKVNELKEEFSGRKLEIIGVSSLNDLLNRRNLVDIKKQNPLVRAGKTARKNILSLSLTAMLAVVIIFSGLWDFDNNPFELYHLDKTMFVKNKNGKILFSKRMAERNLWGDDRQIRINGKCIDINNDGINEIILANEANFDSVYGRNLGRISCYDNQGALLWNYTFNDSVRTAIDVHSKSYIPFIIDTYEERGRTVLYCVANNDPLFPSAIFKLDCKSGERLNDSFWHAGIIVDAFLGDFNEDGKKEIVAIGMQNAFEGTVIFSLNTENLNGQGPASKNYFFLGKPDAKFNKYIFIPVSDIGKIFKNRYGVVGKGSVVYSKNVKTFMFHIIQGLKNNQEGTLLYFLDNKLNIEKIDCSDALQLTRDSLVAQGKLSSPYTNTPEYFNLLKEQIRYWDGKKFVSNFP